MVADDGDLRYLLLQKARLKPVLGLFYFLRYPSNGGLRDGGGCDIFHNVMKKGSNAITRAAQKCRIGNALTS